MTSDLCLIRFRYLNNNFMLKMGRRGKEGQHNFIPFDVAIPLKLNFVALTLKIGIYLRRSS